MARCLVFGGFGFIGSHLTKDLLDAGHEVKIFDKSDHPSELNQELTEMENKPEIITGDFTDSASVSAAVLDVDCIFHYITLTVPSESVIDPNKEIQNINGTLNILKSAVEHGITKIIYPSSGGTVYGTPTKLPVPEEHPLKPTTPYAITKSTIEHLLSFYHNHYDLDYTILRISNPYGPGQNPKRGFGVIPAFYDKLIQSSQPVIYGDGSIIRDYIYISDVIDANLRLIDKTTKNKIFNVGSGKGTSLNQLIELMKTATGTEITPIYEPARKLDIPEIYLDISRIRDELNWEPKVDLKTGLTMMWESLKK